MAKPQTPEEWLKVLAKRLDDRRPHVDKLRSYANGNAPMPEMGNNVRESWQAFQKKARTNYGGLAVDTVCARMVPLGPIVGGQQGDTAKLDTLTQALERVWRDNRARVQIKKAIKDCETTRWGYLLVSQESGKAVLSAKNPENFIAAPDPLRPWKARAYLSVWRDSDAKATFAYVGMEGKGQLFKRDDPRAGSKYSKIESGDWIAVDEEDPYEGEPKVIILERADLCGLFEPHIDLIDRINLGKLQRLVITAMQAYRQRALRKKSGDLLPKEDEDGNEIPWDKIFSPAPGALWDLPEGIDIWESTPVDITPLITGERDDAKTFAAVLRLPISVFTPEGANQSATGASVTIDGLYSLADEEIENLRPAIDLAFVYAMQVEGVDLGGATVQVQFAPPDRVTLNERYAAALQAKSTGILADETIQRDVLGMSPAEIRKNTTALNAERLQLALLFQQSPQPGQQIGAAPSAGGTATGTDVKAKADAMGVMIRAGVDPKEAAAAVGLPDLQFTGAVPVSLRLPEKDANQLEQA